MSAIEIALFVLGAVFFAASFVIPEMRANERDAAISKDEMKKMLNEELKNAQKQMKDTVSETVSYAVEKSDRSLERVSNEKIMALSEYSDTVLEEIGKNHKEALFLYDMLNDKEKDLKNTIRKVEQIRQDVNELQSSGTEAGTVAEELSFQTELQPAADNLDDNLAEGSNDTDMPAADNRKRNRNEQILSLHKQGESNVSIAKELGLGVGEVKLVIDLFEGANG